MSESQFTCPICFKYFKRKGDLNRHRHLHTGDRRYTCEQCDKTFSQFSGLKTHQNVHSKARPYKCGIGGCQSAFGDPSSCSRHRKETHCRASSYQCPYIMCESRIKRRSAFVAHIKKHGIDPSTVNIDMMTSMPFNWNICETVLAETDSSSAMSWLYQPVKDVSVTSAPEYLYHNLTPMAPEPIGQYYGNNSCIPMPYNNTTPNYSIFTNQFPDMNSRCSSNSNSPSPFTFSLSPSPAPSAFGDLNTCDTRCANMSGHIISPQGCADPRELSGWDMDSIFFA